MPITSGLFSSSTIECETPQAFFERLDAEFDFTLDPAATPENAKCKRYYTANEDGLIQPWIGVVFCNPPYGRVIGDWVRKAYEEAQKGSTVVMLIPSRTDTRWWHSWVMKAKEIRFIKGRLKFSGSNNSAPFPSAVVVFGPGEHKPFISAMKAR